MRAWRIEVWVEVRVKVAAPGVSGVGPCPVGGRGELGLGLPPCCQETCGKGKGQGQDSILPKEVGVRDGGSCQRVG